MSALQSIILDKPDLVLLDYEMPVCDGKQVLEMIRSETLMVLPHLFLCQHHISSLSCSKINAALGTVQTVKAEQSLSSLKKLSAPEAKVVRDGQLIKIPAREVTIGDEVVIEAGGYIPPADFRL